MSNQVILNVQEEPADFGFSNGSFFINCSSSNQLFNLSSLTIPQNNYIIASDNVGFSFLKKGYYNFQIYFTITNQNNTGKIFKAHSFISNTSSKVLPISYNQVNGMVNGPKYICINQISYCTGDGALPYFDKYYQKGEPTVGGISPPLIVFGYPCKTNNSNICYSNYYTFSGSISINSLTDIYYIQFAHEGGGSTMSGNGNMYFQYINT